MTARGNALIIHGGGLVDPSRFVLMRIAHNLDNFQVYEKVFIGKYSFESLYKPEFWTQYNWHLVEKLKNKRGTYFGTSRGINLTDPVLSNKAISCLKERNVTTVIVAGGDGSSRQVAEINDTFMKNGINIIFAIPLTMDGINGGMSIGLEQAVRESIRQIENIASASLETRDNEKFGVVIVELQGRNRDDVIANVLQAFCRKKRVADCDFENLFLRVVPANIETDEEKLVEEINNSSKRTLILVSEGANVSIPKLKEKINRKVRSLIVGHPSQSNGMTSKEDEYKYGLWMDKITSIIMQHIGESFCIVKNGEIFYKSSINYYAKLNPRNGQKPEISEDLINLMKSYMEM